MLTLDKLKEIPEGQVFAQGEIENSPEGIYMTNNDLGKKLMWVAKKGYEWDDWTIYIHWAENGPDYVKDHGDKIVNQANIQRLVPCTEEVLNLYRY